MAIVKDEEQQQGQGTSQALGQGMAGQPQPEELQPQQASSAPATIGASQPSQPSMPMPKQPKAGTGTFSNLKNYLQAAQGGGQQRVAQAATQQVQKLGAGAQKGTQQAQEAFGRRMEAGSLKGMETAAQEAKDIVRTARGTTYQAPQPAAQPQTQDYLDRTGGLNEAGLTKLGDKASTFQEELNAINRRMVPMDFGPGSANEAAGIQKGKDREALYEKYGLTQQAQPQAPAQPQQYFTPEQTQRFAEIINTQYQGPASLQQAGLYEQAAQKARTAQEAAQKTQTALGREQLLKDVFGRTREYGRGVSKLDALLLNASQQGVKQLQEQAQPAAKAQEALQAAQNLSANEAAQRQASIEGIRSGARQEFTGARAAEEQAVEERLSQTVENWNQLPDYFKQVLRDKEKGTLALSEQEAGLLGIRAGEGLYNLSPEALVQTSAAERNRLITKNELSRQLALQQLAGTDVSRELQKDLLYTDLEKAGTQTAEDAINKAGIRDVLNAQEKAFIEQVANQNIVGTGSKKHKRTGDRYYAEETANLADVLKRAGYNLESELPTLADINRGTYGGVDKDVDPKTLEGIWKESLTPEFRPEEAINPYTDDSTLARKVAYGGADYATLGITAGLRALGFDVAGGLMDSTDALLGTSIFGGGGPSSRYAKNIASDIARQDLQNQVRQRLEESGFANRTAIGETEQTNLRKAALDQILADRTKLRG